MFKVNIYIETDTACPKETRRWYGYVIEYTLKNGNIITREAFRALDATYNQTILTAITSALAQLTKPCEATVHTKNIHVADSIRSRLEGWVENDFIGPKGDPIKNDTLWRALWRLAKGHALPVNTGSHAYSAWLQNEIKKRKEKEVETPAKAKETES